ncbi:MAG: DUF47 family protein [Candidatus Bathyarchaeia archaeon]
MTLPLESAEQTRRRLLEVCQEHMRKVLETFREVCLMISAYGDRNDPLVVQHYKNVSKCEEEASEIKKTLMREVAEVGMVLLSREDFIRLSSETNTIADYCGGISFRLMELSNRKWYVSNDVAKDIGSLAEASLNCVGRLRETILSLIYGGEKTLEVAKNVESAERIVDDIYRKVDLKIITSKMELPLILMLRDVANFLEEIADMSETANDTAKILAITL